MTTTTIILFAITTLIGYVALGFLSAKLAPVLQVIYSIVIRLTVVVMIIGAVLMYVNN